MSAQGPAAIPAPALGEDNPDTLQSERTKLKRTGSESSVPGYYASLAGQKRKTRSSDGTEGPADGETQALDALIQAKSNPIVPPAKAAPKTKGGKPPKPSPGMQTRRKEEEGAAALLGLSRSDSALAGTSLVPAVPGANSEVPGMFNTMLQQPLPYTCAPGQSLLPSQVQPLIQRQQSNKSKSAVKRQRSNASRRSSEAAAEPLLDIKLPDGPGPWEGIEVTLRYGKYKGKSAQVLGLAKKKYRVQVQGLDYQLEFYPSYVGLPEPPPQDDEVSAEPKDNLSMLQRVGTNQSANSIVVANVERSPVSALARVASGSSEGSKSSKACTNATTSLESYRGWIGKTVTVKRGKYQGRQAWVLGLASEKLRVVVENVEHQLEYYPTMFEPPQDSLQTAPQSTALQIPAAQTVLPTVAPGPGSVPVIPQAAAAPISMGLVRVASCMSAGNEVVTAPPMTLDPGLN